MIKMAYCTNAELTALTGTSLATNVQDGIIDQSDREISAVIGAAGLTAPTSNDDLKTASLNLSIVAVWTHPDAGDAATSIKLEDITIQRNQLAVFTADLMKRAWALVDAYIKANGTKCYVQRVN